MAACSPRAGMGVTVFAREEWAEDALLSRSITYGTLRARGRLCPGTFPPPAKLNVGSALLCSLPRAIETFPCPFTAPCSP